MTDKGRAREDKSYGSSSRNVEYIKILARSHRKQQCVFER